jgi:hypothetical protein
MPVIQPNAGESEATSETPTKRDMSRLNSELTLLKSALA